MRIHRARRACVLAVALSAIAAPAGAQSTPDQGRGVAAFNRALEAATRRMDNDAVLALWDDDGTSLLPSTKPIVGKPALAEFLRRVTSGNPGARMESFQMECFDIQVSAPWASEWCTEHQVVALGGGKRFDGRGRMLLILHRTASGEWLLHTEMWNQAD